MQSPAAPPRDEREFYRLADLLIALTKALHHVGLPAHVIEEKVGQAAAVLGIELDMLCLPTGILLTLYHEKRPVTYAIRERPGVVNLERMTLVMQAAAGLIAGTLAPDQAQAKIHEIMRAPTAGAQVQSSSPTCLAPARLPSSLAAVRKKR